MKAVKLVVLLCAALGLLLGGVALADSNSVNFETYTPGVINGQDSWTSKGAAGSGCAMYDVAVDGSFGYASFGSQSLRLSDAVTSGCFGDQTFSKPLGDSVGESTATADGFPVGTRQRHFEMQFDLASAVPGAQQPGMHLSVSPDRGDGSRMSYLRFEDNAGGLDVFFDDVQGTSNPANFVETTIATGLDRSVPHTIKLTLDTLEGASDDIVKVWIDGVLVKTGTSWENYYRYDSESSAEQSPRIVRTVLFRESGTAHPANLGKGFLVDNLSLFSGPFSYTFNGFFAPVDNPPTVNVAKAGQTIPVKWQLLYPDGSFVSDPLSFVSLTPAVTNCTSGASIDYIETYSTGSGLQYLGSGNWQYNFKTLKTYSGMCGTLTLTLNDGTSNTAKFEFR